MRTLSTLKHDIKKLVEAGTHRAPKYWQTLENGDTDVERLKKSLVSYVQDGSITVDFNNQQWSFTGTGIMAGKNLSFNYKDVFVVFCKDYTQCQQFENNIGKFATLICVDLDTKKVYSCTKNNNGNVTLQRLYKTPWIWGLDNTREPLYKTDSSLLDEGVLAYDYTS